MPTRFHRSFLPRALIVEWAVGCAISVGSGTKIEYSTRSKPPKKESETLTLLNRMIVDLLYLLLFICIVDVWGATQT